MILYRHFASKADLYRAVLESANTRLVQATGIDDFDDASIPALIRAAAADPDAFRLLFRYAVREPEFRDMIDTLIDQGDTRSPAATSRASPTIDGGAGRRDYSPP